MFCWCLLGIIGLQFVNQFVFPFLVDLLPSYSTHYWECATEISNYCQIVYFSFCLIYFSVLLSAYIFIIVIYSWYTDFYHYTNVSLLSLKHVCFEVYFVWHSRFLMIAICTTYLFSILLPSICWTFDSKMCLLWAEYS